LIRCFYTAARIAYRWFNLWVKLVQAAEELHETNYHY